MSVLFWPSLFLALGLLLLLVEVFIPSGGMIGLCSLLCLAAEPVVCLQPIAGDGRDVHAGGPRGLAAHRDGGLFALVALAAGAKVLPRLPRAARRSKSRMPSTILIAWWAWRGKRSTPLRPSGTVEIDGAAAGEPCRGGISAGGHAGSRHESPIGPTDRSGPA